MISPPLAPLVFGQLSGSPRSDLIEKWRAEREREGAMRGDRESIEMCLETAFVIQSTAHPAPWDKFRGLNGQTPL